MLEKDFTFKLKILCKVKMELNGEHPETNVDTTVKMTDPRLESHQHFDIIRCKLCDNIYHDPRLLSCLHSFCKSCLDNYVKDPAVQRDDGIACPTCKEVTSFNAGETVDALLKNLVLERLITQAEREQTKVVAEQEVLKIQAEALTEAELASEDVQKTILRIANTAGQVIAHKTEDQSRVHDFESIKHRQELQKKIGNLQEKALDVVYAIDEVNQDMETWETVKEHLRLAVKQRSLELQSIIQVTERQLLARVDDKNFENEIKDLGYETKTNLHKTLKGTLNVVDFLKLLVEYGDKENLESYQEIADERIDKFMKETTEYKQKSLAFDPPKVDLTEAIELMFGSIKETTEMKTVWNPLEPKQKLDTTVSQKDSSPDSDVESHKTLANQGEVREEAHLTPRYAEINESSQENETKKSKVERNSALKHGRRPLKSSMSFNEGTSRFLYQHGVPSTHSHFIKRHAEVHMQNENDPSQLGDSQTNEDGTAADETGHISSSLYPGHYMGRRSSAPCPSRIIDALAKRRLNALSILERSNISTKGLDIPSDAEVGFNQARLEWMRDEMKRKNEGLRRSSIQEDE